MAQKLFLSNNNAERFDTLSYKLWIDWKTLVRIAFWISLYQNWVYVKTDYDSKSKKEFNRYSLIGDEYEWFYRTLLETVYDKKFDDDEFFSNNSPMKYHIEAWLDFIWDKYQELWEDVTDLKIKILEFNNNINSQAGNI